MDGAEEYTDCTCSACWSKGDRIRREEVSTPIKPTESEDEYSLRPGQEMAKQIDEKKKEQQRSKETRENERTVLYEMSEVRDGSYRNRFQGYEDKRMSSLQRNVV